MIVNIAEAKANLSKLITLASQGQRIVIARNNRPVVDLVIHQGNSKRQLGLLAGKFTVPDSFTAESDEINVLFCGDA